MSPSLGFWLLADWSSTFRVLRMSGPEIDALSRERLSRLLVRVARTNEFYARRLQEAGIESADALVEREPYRVLAAMTPVSKLELRRAGRRVLQSGRTRGSWYSSASSGSTGEPFRVYYDARAWARLKYLVKLRGRYACGVRLTDRIALLETTDRRDPSASTGRWTRISVLQPPEKVAVALQRFAPDVVYGLPSALLEAGRVLEAQRARLGIRAIFTSGELLHGITRSNLENLYGAAIFDVYGTSETKEIAWECRAGRMHLNQDVVQVEVVDEFGHDVPAGVEGDLVVTNLVNTAMPLLRYRTGDRGVLLNEQCSCGCALPLLGVVTGRSADTLVLQDGYRVSPYALTCAIEQVPGLLRYQVSQLDRSRLRVRAIPDAGADRAAIIAQVRTALRYDVAPFLDADVEFVDRLPSGPRAKFRVVEALE